MSKKTEDKIIVKALSQIGLVVSPQVRIYISITYHSCAIEGCTLTIEETAKNIGRKLKKQLQLQQKVRFEE